MENIILLIDTSKSDKLITGLEIGGDKRVLEENFDFRKSQGILPLIEKFLKTENLSFSDLSGIEVNIGPGSFTGLRVGVSIANSMGTILQIPINGKPVGLLAEPIYI